MKKVLITGASGFIGSNVLRAMSDKPVDIHAVHSRSAPTARQNVQWHQADLLDPVDVKSLFRKVKPDYLIHLAWCTAQGQYWTDQANLDWLTSSIHIGRSFLESGGQRAVFGGTSAEYDWSGNVPLLEQKTPLVPLKLYGGCKVALYWAATRFFEQEQTAFSWVRFFNPFGEGEDVKRLIPKTCFRLLAGEHIRFDSATSLRDFLHVQDVGEAVAAVLQSSYNGAVNIGSGHPISVRAVLETIAEIYGLQHQLNFETSDLTKAIADSVTADTTILNQVCGWKQSVSFHDRMKQTCKWWKHQYKTQ